MHASLVNLKCALEPPRQVVKLSAWGYPAPRGWRLGCCGESGLRENYGVANLVRQLAVAAVGLSLGIAPLSVFSDEPSRGPQGINAADLPLTGAGVAIGQVEESRPSTPDFDHPLLTNSYVVPAAVFSQTSVANPNIDVGPHSIAVASVMISNDPLTPGVAPDADLYASAFVIANDMTALRAVQHIAQQADGNVRAINMSFGLQGTPDGESLLSLGVDWVARRYDVLLVNSGLQENLTNYRPKDAHNNLVVGRLTTDEQGEFNRLSSLNQGLTLAGGRTRPDILAPGDGIQVAKAGDGSLVFSGTSFAAPHVTGTAALLHQLAEQEIAQANPRMPLQARRHEVMKAVLLNSADKVADAGDGLRLGMQKTILDTEGRDWLQSPAATSPLIPLDDQLGVGALNAARAVEQLVGGEWGPNGKVAPIGWDYRETAGAGDITRYAFNRPLLGGSYLAATLVWDALVELIEGNANDVFDVGESFFDAGLVNLDLYLMPKGAESLTQVVWASTANDDWNIEHLFVPIPETGNYELWVAQREDFFDPQFYALAWHAVTVPEPVWALHLMFAASLLVVVGRRLARR